MDITVEVPCGDPDLMAWCEEQGYNPCVISYVVTIHPQEREITLREYLLDEEGHRYMDPERPGDVAVKEHRFRPTRHLPFNP